MIVAGQDVLDAEQHEAARRAHEVLAPTDREARLAGVGREGELLGAARRLDLGQGVMVGAEHVEDVVLDDQLAHRAPAGEVDEHREAGGVGGRGQELARPRLAANTIRLEDDLRSDDSEQLLAVHRAAGAREAKGLGQVGRQRRDRQGQAVAHGAPAHRDGGVAGRPPAVGPRRGRRGDERDAEPDAPEHPAHCLEASRSTSSHSCPTNRDIR